MTQAARTLQYEGAASDAQGHGSPHAAPPAGWIPADQAARHLGVSLRTVQLRCADGRLVARKDASGQWHVDPACNPTLRVLAGDIDTPAASTSTLAHLSKAKREGIARKVEAVEAYLAAEAERPDHISKVEFLKSWLAAWKARTGGAISQRTLYAWLRQYREGGAEGLADGRTYHGESRMSPEAWEMFLGLWLDESRPSIPRLHERVAHVAHMEGWDWPSVSTIRRKVREEVPNAVKLAGRNPKHFRDRALPYIERDWTRVPAMGCWVADHRQIDVLVPHYGPDNHGRMRWSWRRPYLTMFLDARSWMPVAWRLAWDAPNSDRVMSVFADGIRTHGQPAHVYLDNGKDFRARKFAGGRTSTHKAVAEQHVKPIVEMLGIGVTFAIPYNAKAKIVEPWFKHMADWWDKTWDTYCGRSSDSRPERLKALNGKAERMARDGLTLEAVAAGLEAWIADDYARRPSPATAAGGLSPIRALHELRDDEFIPRRPSDLELALLLLPSKRVTVRQNGIWVKHFQSHYMADELADRRGSSGRDRKRQVVYRYDPEDASRIYVFDAESDRFLAVAEPREVVHPLAEAGSDDADRLSAQMALRRGLEKQSRKHLKTLRQSSRNALLISSREAAEALGKRDDYEPEAPTPILRITDSETGRAAKAGADHAETQRRTAEAERQQTESISAREWLLTGTDHHAPAADTGDVWDDLTKEPDDDDTTQST